MATLSTMESDDLRDLQRSVERAEAAPVTAVTATYERAYAAGAARTRARLA